MVSARSFLNSAGLLQMPQFVYDIVRPGLLLYGYSPVDRYDIGLKPVMKLYSRVLHCFKCEVGREVGYSSLWKASRPSKIAVISMGYADGFPLICGSKDTGVYVNGHFCPIVGRVAMDVMNIDVTDCPGLVSPGDKVEIWGDKQLLTKLSSQIKMNPRLLMSAIGQRVERVVEYSYVKADVEI